MTERAELLEAIKANAVVHGDFVLSSGQRADFYVDLRRILLDGRLAPLAGRVMLDLTWDLGYEAVGETDSKLETFADWQEPFRKGVVYYLSEGRVRGVLLWNVWEQVDAARRLITAPGPFKPQDLKGKLPA